MGTAVAVGQCCATKEQPQGKLQNIIQHPNRETQPLKKSFLS